MLDPMHSNLTSKIMTFPKTIKELRSSLDKKEAYTYTYFWSGPFSQWYQPCKFSHIDNHGKNIIYNCAEQYMMAEKARLFNDKTILHKILTNVHPKQQKELGRIVKNYNENTWQNNRIKIVIDGNIAKFSQNLELKEQLLATGESILVEASPVDSIWGIGLNSNHPDSGDPYKWKGLNLLGFCLTTVREFLKQENS